MIKADDQAHKLQSELTSSISLLNHKSSFSHNSLVILRGINCPTEQEVKGPQEQFSPRDFARALD